MNEEYVRMPLNIQMFAECGEEDTANNNDIDTSKEE